MWQKELYFRLEVRNYVRTFGGQSPGQRSHRWTHVAAGDSYGGSVAAVLVSVVAAALCHRYPVGGFAPSLPSSMSQNAP